MKRLMYWTIRWTTIVFVVAASVAPRAAWACSACYGAPGAAQTRGMNLGILSMLVVTGVVLGGFGGLFFSFARRARRHNPELTP